MANDQAFQNAHGNGYVNRWGQPVNQDGSPIAAGGAGTPKGKSRKGAMPTQDGKNWPEGASSYGAALRIWNTSSDEERGPSSSSSGQTEAIKGMLASKGGQ